MGTPADNPRATATSSVLTHVDQLRGDLLVIHGMLDENVHFRHTARLATALIAAAKPFGLLPLPDERHSSRREADRKYVAERLADHFEAALAPRPTGTLRSTDQILAWRAVLVGPDGRFSILARGREGDEGKEGSAHARPLWSAACRHFESGGNEPLTILQNPHTHS